MRCLHLIVRTAGTGSHNQITTGPKYKQVDNLPTNTYHPSLERVIPGKVGIMIRQVGTWELWVGKWELQDVKWMSHVGM